MPIVYVLLVIAAVGCLVWALKFVPWIDDTFKTMIKVVAVLGTVLWIASLFGLFSHLSAIKVGR